MQLLSYAKINLFLHVTGKKPDGYHELCMLMCRVGIKDEITLTPGTGRGFVDCDLPGIPCDDSNLVIKALNLFGEASGIDKGADISIKKKIPAGAGLGGGSSNAAAVLTGLNRFYGNVLSEQKLLETGLKIGADVPFFISGGPSIVTGIGEKLEKVNKIKPYHLVIVWPGVGLSTGEVYKNFNLGLTNYKKKTKSRLLNAGKIDPLELLHNDLELPAIKMSGFISVLKKMMMESGAEGSLMSGSGSAVFGLFNSVEKAQAAGDIIENNLGNQKLYSGYKLFVTQMIV
jgi:4-diphosphocytidyl-2-C-methyl-D-erythritol kinase